MANIKSYLEELLKKTVNKCKGSNSRVSKEYDELEQVPPAPGRPDKQHDSMIKNKLCQRACKNEDKNRYCNLFPFDKNLFQFTNEDEYINASWIHFEDGSKYIVTMAPMLPKYDKSTCPDFWRMCWQTKAKVIVMLCNVTPGFSGCSQYFPANLGSFAKHGLFTVKQEKSVEFTNFVEREFVISNGSDNHTIHQFHYKEWPNYGLPEAGVTEFVTYVHKRASELNGAGTVATVPPPPHLIVHCSGGIGRSGTFLTSFVAYTKLLELVRDFNATGNVDSLFVEGVSLTNLVLRMRTQRHPWMVEGVHQYCVAYEIVIQLIKNQIKLLSQ